MPLLPVAVIADDLTGAADTAAAFARPGRAVAVSLEARPLWQAGLSAFAVSTESRSSPPEVARERVAASVGAAAGAGAGLIYKKVDSNLRGNLGPELAALRDGGFAPAVLAPAFPARGRTVVDGVALVGGVPAAETEMGRDPEAPVRESRIADLLRAQQPDLRLGHCSLDDVRSAGDWLGGRLAGVDVVVADAETEADLARIATAALALCPAPVLAGSAGLARVVAERLLGPARPLALPKGARGPVFAVLASSSERTARQVSAAAAGGVAVVRFPCQDLTWDEDSVPELTQAIEQAVEALRGGRDAIVYADGPLPEVARPVDLVVEHLAHLAFVVVKLAAPVALLVGGGSTSHAVLRTLGVGALEVDDEPLLGIAAGLAVGGHAAGRPVALKPGAAGDETALATLLRYLARRAALLEDGA